jgi:hypothetical protein
MATPPEIQETRNVNSTQIALAALGVLLLLVVLWFLFLRGGGEDPALETVPAPPPVENVDPVEPVDPGDGNGRGDGNGPVETFEVFAPKDPFKPLVTADAGDTPTDGIDADGDGQIDSDEGGGDGTGTGTDGDGDGGTGTGTGTGSGGGENVGGHRVSLVDVFRAEGGQRAQVQVDGTVYTVDEGDRFADNFQLLSINGECATMLYGDDQFTLCEGEEILK